MSLQLTAKRFKIDFLFRVGKPYERVSFVDIVAHVAFNIEIQSDDQCPLCILFDRVDNVRGDGTNASIQTFTSTADSHSACHRAGTESMNFVLSRLSGILLAP